MNRYRNVPGLKPTSKATPTTLCQKCLKRDNYECKASAQERPYTSRPSRSQQLANPKLAPKLMSDVPNDLLRTKGVADEQLALRESERGRKREAVDERDDEPIRSHSRKRARSASPAYSSSSVSTISTNRSWSQSPRRKRDMSRSPYRSRERKRKMSDSLSDRSNITASSVERRGAPSKALDRNTRRRRKSRSPSARGRHRDSDRRGVNTPDVDIPVVHAARNQGREQEVVHQGAGHMNRLTMGLESGRKARRRERNEA
ncbi:hypothetical protein FQN55_003690 [Onygenales sp. PD_40]|nr:hypothetical protein FQN55_003690 [Onygenales sp. PD_40]